MSTKMNAAQISKAGGDWELVERDIPEPGSGDVRVKVEACGICHSDSLVKDGIWGAGRASRTTDDQCFLFNHATELCRWMVFRHSEGFARHPGI
jgi:hypothetical protein